MLKIPYWPARKVAPAETVSLFVKPGWLLRRLTRGNLANVHFSDFSRLLRALGFRQVRSSGSHHIFSHPEIPEQVNLQNVRGQTKPYQIRQCLKLIERYNLRLEDEK